MSNPFALNALNGYSPTSAAASVSNPYIGGGKSGQVGAGSIFGAQGAQGQPKVGGINQQSELNDVSQIGASKKAGYMNGLGGTNNPDDHKLFMYA